MKYFEKANSRKQIVATILSIIVGGSNNYQDFSKWAVGMGGRGGRGGGVFLGQSFIIIK